MGQQLRTRVKRAALKRRVNRLKARNRAEKASKGKKA